MKRAISAIVACTLFLTGCATYGQGYVQFIRVKDETLRADGEKAKLLPVGGAVQLTGVPYYVARYKDGIFYLFGTNPGAEPLALCSDPNDVPNMLCAKKQYIREKRNDEIGERLGQAALATMVGVSAAAAAHESDNSVTPHIAENGSYRR